MTVDELRELLEQLGLGELGTDTPWDGRRIDGLVSLGLAEYRGNGWYSITDAGRELLEALRDRERLELALAEEVAGTRAITATQDSTTTVEQSTTDEHMCPNCFSCNSSLVMTLSGKTSGHCKTCGHDWTSQETSDDSSSE